MNTNTLGKLLTRDADEMLFKRVSAVGLAATILTAGIWTLLSPTLLVVLLFLPAAFFTYAYREGVGVVS